MSDQAADTHDDRLKKLELLAEKVGPRRPSIWDLITIGATVLLVLVISLVFIPGRQVKEVPSSNLIPAASAIEHPAFVLLGRYNDEIYFFSEPNGKVFRYDPQKGTSESVFDLSSYQTHLWSPQGNKITIVSTQDNDSGDLYVVDLSKPIQSPKPLTRRSKDTIPKSFVLLSTSPMAWSPNETLVAFVAYDDDVSDIFAVATDGSGIWRVTTNQKKLSSITWIDADTLGFVIQENAQYKKYLIQIDGSGWQEW